ncbi:hypothetical protein JCM5350_007862 [Sporobolomyces pararoseus]
MSGLHPWLASEWDSQRCTKGCELLSEPSTTGKRLQYVQSLAETEEDGEKLIWVRMADTELIIDVCIPSNFINGFYNVWETSFTSSGADKSIFKLLSWKFVLACPPNPSQLHQASSSKSNSIVETLSKRVCLRINELSKFGDTDGTIFKAHKDRELIDFRKFERVKATVEAVEHPEERQAQAEIVYADDLPRFGTQPEVVAAPIPGPSNQRLSFAAPAPASTVAPRQSTSTSTSTSSSSSSSTSFDWSLVAWPPQDIDYSKPSRSNGELEKLWLKKKVKRVEDWKGKGRRIDPSLEQSLKEQQARTNSFNTVVAAATTEVGGSRGGGGGGGRKSSKEKEKEKQKRRSTSSRPRQLPTPTKTSLAGTSSISRNTSGSTSNVQEGDKEKKSKSRSVLPDSPPPVDNRSSASPSQRASQNSQTRSQQRSHSRSQPRSKDASSQAGSTTLAKGKERAKEALGESESDEEVEAEEAAMVPWEETPTPETLALAIAATQAQELAERKRQQKKQEERDRIHQEREKEQLHEAEESDSEKEDDDSSSRQLVLPPPPTQKQLVLFSIKRQLQAEEPPTRHPRSSSRRQTQRLPPSPSLAPNATQPSRHSLPDSSHRYPSLPMTQQQQQEFSSFPLPTAAQHPASQDLPTPSAWDAALGDGEDFANATAENISLTQQEEGFPKGGQEQQQQQQQQQQSGTVRRSILRENTSSGSTVTSSKRRREMGTQGKENDGEMMITKKQKKTAESEKIEKRKSADVKEEKKEEVAVVEKKRTSKKVEKRVVAGTKEGNVIEKVKKSEQTIEGDVSTNKKRPRSIKETAAVPSSPSSEKAHQSKKSRHDGPRYPPPIAPAPLSAPRSSSRTQTQPQTQPRLSTTSQVSQVSFSQNPEWISLSASLAPRPKADSKTKENPIEKMWRLREKRKRHEATLMEMRQSLI